MAVTRQNLSDRLNRIRNATAAMPITREEFATFLDDWINFMTKDGQYDMGALDAWKAQSLSQSSQVSHTPSGQITGVNVKTALEQLDGLNKAVKDAFVRPVARPAVTLDFANAKMIDPQYAFSRNSVGTYIDKNGQMRVSQANQPRFYHDSGTLECTGLLLEGSRTNILLFSSDISNSYWSKGPNTTHVGVTTLLGYPANTFLHSAGSSYIDRAVSIVPNKTYTYSYYSSIATTNYCPITKAGVFSRNVNNYVVTLVATGVYKHELTFTTTSDENQIFLRLATTDVAGTVTVGMAQLEEGDFSTSYIPTVGSAVTRQPDLLNISSTAFLKNLGGMKEGGILMVGKYKGVGEAGIVELRGNDTAGWNTARQMFQYDSIRTNIVKDGIAQNDFSINTNYLAEVKSVICFATNLLSLRINATASSTIANNINIPTNIDRINVFSTGVMNIKQIAIFKRVLTDTEAIAITTPQTNKYASILDMSGMAFVTPEAILRRTGRQEFSIDGTGASITRNIRRPYDFNFEIIDSSGVTITSQPAVTCLANTDNALIFTAAVGKTITYAVTTVFEY